MRFVGSALLLTRNRQLHVHQSSHPPCPNAGPEVRLGEWDRAREGEGEGKGRWLSEAHVPTGPHQVPLPVRHARHRQADLHQRGCLTSQLPDGEDDAHQFDDLGPVLPLGLETGQEAEPVVVEVRARLPSFLPLEEGKGEAV